MITLSALADEISPDMDTQLDVLESEGIRHLDFRGAFNKKVMQLSDEEIDIVHEKIHKRGFTVSCVASWIGKYNIGGDLDSHLHDFKRIVEIAKKLHTRHIRIFSFYYGLPGKPDAYRDAILQQLNTYIAIAEQEDVVLLHENELRIYGDNLRNTMDLLESCKSPHFRAILDPGNFLRTGVKPATYAYPVLKPYLDHVHIKDSRFSMQAQKYVNVPAGEGDGELRLLMYHLMKDQFTGVLSIEPHLKPRSPESFRRASAAIKTILGEVGLAWT